MVTLKKLLRSSRLPVVGAGLAALALALPACETGTGVPSIPAITNAAVSLTVDPSPITATQNTATKAVTAKFKLTLQEVNGLGGDVQFVSVSVFDPTAGAQLAIVYFDGPDLVVYIGTKRLEALGTLVIPETLNYVLADGTIAANVVINVQIKDDRSNLINRSILAKVQ